MSLLVSQQSDSSQNQNSQNQPDEGMLQNLIKDSADITSNSTPLKQDETIEDEEDDFDFEETEIEQDVPQE